MTTCPVPLTAHEQAFVLAHITNNVGKLLLQTANLDGIDIKKIAVQLTARQKAVHKLPGWYANMNLLFPPALSVEQASSETAATYKAGLVSGAVLIDATGGMGVDAQAFARRMGRVEYVEQNPLLAELAAYNLPRLGAGNVGVTHHNGLDFIRHYTGRADWIYLDPARRDESGGKVVQLAGYEPDITGVMPTLLEKTSRVLLKTSPLIDVDQTIRQLAQVEAVHIVAVQHEVKEVLFVIGQAVTEPTTVPITAVDLANRGDGPTFTFDREAEKTAAVTLGEPLRYICEPNAAVLKSGAFRLVATRFALLKLAPHSHLYTAQVPPVNFPGRVFELQQIIRSNRSELKTVVPGMKANLTTRNFPETVAILRKKLGLLDGGEVYIFATTLSTGDKRLLITRKLME